MKLLIVGFSESIHTARWIDQISDQGWEIHIFPATDNGGINGQLTNVTVHHSFYDRHHNQNKRVKIKGIPVYSSLAALALRLILKQFKPDYRHRTLTRLIQRLQPDIIHSMEFQHSSYLVDEVKAAWKEQFPTWIATNWGSDIYLFGRFSEHKDKIKKVLDHCDYYSCECQRDVCLAQDFGYKGKVLPVFPNTGGFNLAKISQLRSGKTSQRKIIMLKGYQGWSGRALVGLAALERCQDLLKGYELVITSIQPDTGVDIAARLFEAKTGVKTHLVPLHTPHEKILSYHGQARISIGLGVSDAISTALLEAMVMGSFPIQSSTACADEWIKDGVTGAIVPPEDPSVIEKVLRKALTDDQLVDKAAKENYQTATNRLDQKNIKPKTIKFYTDIMREKGE